MYIKYIEFRISSKIIIETYYLYTFEVQMIKIV